MMRVLKTHDRDLNRLVHLDYLILVDFEQNVTDYAYEEDYDVHWDNLKKKNKTKQNKSFENNFEKNTTKKNVYQLIRQRMKRASVDIEM